jgi:hypothetical protein
MIGTLPILQNRTFYFGGAFIVSLFYKIFSDRPIKFALCRKKKKTKEKQN